MTLLHVSVRGLDEALLALRHGANAIHVADGSPDAIVAAVGGRVPVTVSADGDEATSGGDAAHRVRVIALGAFNPAAAAELSAKGYSGVMLDAGQGTRLFDRTDIGVLATLVDAARGAGLSFGISGGLEPPDIPRLLLLAPDVLRLDRRPLRGGAIDALRALIPAASAPPGELDQRRRSTRREETDRVFVRDFVLPMHIGVYAREYDQTQKVRFDVDVRVLRQTHAPAGMRDIFSYDIITDSIRMIAAREHVALVEGLAETIAARLLTYPRVASVTVRVEKLDTGPGGVGVEITRERPAAAATVLTLPRSGEGTV